MTEKNVFSFTKDIDDKARDFTVNTLLPNWGVNYIHPFCGQYDAFDISYLPTKYEYGKGKERYIEIKTRHVSSTQYDTTFIEEDKWNEIQGARNYVHMNVDILFYFTDGIVILSSENIDKCFVKMGTCYGCPDEYAPNKWRKVNKYGAFLSVKDSPIIPWDKFDISCPEWVSTDINKGR